MVAGARYEAVETIPGRKAEFDWDQFGIEKVVEKTSEISTSGRILRTASFL